MSTTVSRNPTFFLERKGLAEFNTVGPRLNPMDLLVHQYPTGNTFCKRQLAEGDPPPDRVDIRDWAPPA